MALLDFMKDRKAGQQQAVANKSQEQKPQTAKEMYTQQDTQEKTNRRPARDDMPPDQQAKVETIKATLEKATQHADKSAQSPSPTPADDTGSREALRQNMTGQDKAVPALSPTSAQAGQPATEKNTPGPSNETPAKTQEKQSGPVPPTLPRPRPSWER
jgi:hypothetical protein